MEGKVRWYRYALPSFILLTLVAQKRKECSFPCNFYSVNFTADIHCHFRTMRSPARTVQPAVRDHDCGCWLLLGCRNGFSTVVASPLLQCSFLTLNHTNMKKGGIYNVHRFHPPPFFIVSFSVPGVQSTEVGYIGGLIDNPT